MHDKHSKTGDPAVGSTRLVRRWASIGDTIEATLSDGKLMRCGPLTTIESCAIANEFIADGRWRVLPNVPAQQWREGPLT